MHHILMGALMVVIALEEGYDTIILPSMIACGGCLLGNVAPAARLAFEK